MKTASINISLYSFEELSEKAQERAIREHREFLLSVMQPSDFISGDPEYDTPEQLSAAYESEYDYVLFNDDPVIESIECNEYLFFEDGSISNCVTFCGNHPRAGQTVLRIYGNEYVVA